ncbi:MAG: glycosyltransferase family 4 protein [Ktedonobacteraceae bacterium]
MKIAHIAPPWIAIPPKNYGGTEIVLYNLVEEQIAQGHDVTLLAPGDAKTSAKLVSFFPRSLIDSGVPWEAHLKSYYHLYKSVEYVKAHNFDIVHVHLSSSSDMFVFPLVAHLGLPAVATLHSRFPFDRVQLWTGDADDYYMEWASSVPMIAISERARAEVKYPVKFIGVVHHGLPLDQFQPTVAQPENYLVWLGRLVPEKGAHLAIEAARAVGMPLVLAGTIDRHVKESVDYYEQTIKPCIDGERVKYIGPVDMQEKVDVLSRAKAFLNPITWEEPFGMVMIEAMAVGCPVIAFARGAAPEIVAHGNSGYLVHNVNEMIKYIHKIDALDRKVVRAHVEKNFSVRAMANKYTKLYKKVQSSALLQSALPKMSVTNTPVPASMPITLPAATVRATASEAATYPSTISAKVAVERDPSMLQ